MNYIANETISDAEMESFFTDIYKEPKGYVPEYELTELEYSLRMLTQNVNESIRGIVDSMQRIRKLNHD